MKRQWKVPFDHEGNQVTYYSKRRVGFDYNDNQIYVSDPRVTLKENYEFEALLQYKGFERGRSSLNIVWTDENGKEYRSGMSMLDDILSGRYPFLKIDNRVSVQGKFTFKKQGTSILLKIVNDK